MLQALSSAVHSHTMTFVEGEGRYWAYFGFIVVLGFLMRLACMTGLIASDDLGYSRYALLIAQHGYTPELHHFALRYGLTIPVAAAYGFFGVREWTTILIPVLASTASVPALMLIGRKLLGFRTALLAGVLIATFPVELRYATILVPEPVAEFYILVAVLIYLYRGYRHPVLVGFATGVCVGMAYLTKESALFVAPALLIDAGARRQWYIFLGIALGLLMIVAVEHSYYVALTADLLFRPHAMIQHNHSPMVLASNRHLWWRLLKAYPRMMILPNTDFGLHSLFSILLVIPACLVLAVEKWRLLLLWALLPWLYLNFGTSSFSHYLALPAADRYILFVFPPLFLLSAGALNHISSLRRRAALHTTLALGIVAASGFYCGFVTRGQGWRTDAVKVLRVIGEQARERHLSTVSFEGDQQEEWRHAMGILNHDLRTPADSRPADIIIRSDAFGLPSTVPKGQP